MMIFLQDSGFIAFGRAGEIIMTLGLLVSCLGCVGGSICCISRNLQVRTVLKMELEIPGI